jgi:acyl-coenzyme A synthetase/AMP-(fatty) acid ligase
MNTWFDHILFHARAQPDSPAIVMEDRAVTYGMLGAAIERCARRIAALNLRTDGLVAVQISNPIRNLTLSLALYRLGLRSISLAHRQPGVELASFAAVLGDRDAVRNAGNAPHVIEITEAAFGEDVAAPADMPRGFAGADAICRVSLTSGSTGLPKSVELSVENLGRNAMEKFIGCLNTSRSGILCMPGLTSNFGFSTACGALIGGRPLYFAESPYQAIRMIELFSIDFAVASSEQLLALTRVARKSGVHLKSLHSVMTGGGVLTRALLEAAIIHVCRNIICRYGATEIGAITQTSARDVLLSPGLAGRVLPGVEVGVFNAQGEPQDNNRAGTIHVRDAMIGFAGAAASWTDLGDIGWLTPDGRLYVLGRAVDIDAVGSKDPQLSPVHEIEHLFRLEWDATDAAAVLIEDNGTSCIVIGVVDGVGASAEKLAVIARQRGIEHPIRITALKTIPRGANGKINRAELTALIASVA